MNHLKKFFEYYVVDPNFDAFRNEVRTVAENKFKDEKDISFDSLKSHVISSFGGDHEFKYGDDYAQKLVIIDQIVSGIIKGIDESKVNENHDHHEQTEDIYLNLDSISNDMLGLFIAHTYHSEGAGPWPSEVYGMSEEIYEELSLDPQIAIAELMKRLEGKH